jgi:membrane fusion protein, heavy metal efflux system
MRRLVTACLLLAILFACNSNKTEQHAHNPDGSHPGEEGLASLSYTLYTDKSELFVEFKPLVVGSTSKFAAHLTKLGDNFKPFTEGTVTVSLILNNNGIRNESTAPSSPGIFRLALQPTTAGTGKLEFDIVTSDFTDKITINSVVVYPDEQTAKNNQPKEEVGSDISFLKEQAWKIEFANAPEQKQPMSDVIKTTGQIVAAPGDEVVIAAKSTGIVKFTGTSNVIGAPVRTGQAMFAVAGGGIAEDNIDAAIQQARAELNIAKAEYDRANDLITDKLITQRQFEDAKLRYENSRIRLNNLTQNYGASGKSLSSPINGFVKNILVNEGQYVSAGQPLATITKNKKLVLRADVSLKDADKVNRVQEANFTIIQNKQTYNTKALNARLIAIAKTTGDNSPYIPVHFEMDTQPGIIPGSFAEVYLKTASTDNALVVPVSALIEEQGIFYVYVQTAGESFQKREVKLGVNDGEKVQVLSGVNEGERIVTKGAYQVKLASVSGAMPAHGHEH